MPAEPVETASTTKLSPRISVILCTLNPRLGVMEWVFKGLREQTLPGHQVEVVLVDNNSNPPVSRELFGPEPFVVRRVIERRPGLLAARLCGLREASGEIIAFLDDDTRPDPDYLERSVRLAESHPEIGCFGGRIRAEFEEPPPSWVIPLLAYVGVRDFGPDPIRRIVETPQPWEPIGVMVVRRRVTDRFSAWVSAEREAQTLGRRGSNMISGEDTLLTRSAAQCGLGCAYEPSLGCRHRLASNRFRPAALARLLVGMGRSHAKLNRLCGQRSPSWPRAIFTLAGALLNRLRRSGPRAGLLEWLFDWGWMLESKER